MTRSLAAWMVSIACVLIPWRASGQCDPARLPAVTPGGSVQALAVYRGELYAGTAGFGPSGVLRWDGRAWVGQQSTPPVFAMAVYRGDLIAAGTERWDGSTWQHLDDEGPNRSVEAMLPFSDELVMAGNFTKIGTRPFNHAVRWNGIDWLPMGAGLDGEVRALAVYNDQIIAGGLFVTSGGRTVNHIARWDGAQWQPIGAGIDGVVDDFAVYHGELIAGGLFFTVGGAAIDSIARWDGAGWHPLGAGLISVGPVPAVLSMTIYHGDLIAGGFLIAADGRPANRIARWDGAQWHALDSDLTGPVYALAVHEHQLIAGCGPPTTLARWECPSCAADVDDDGQVDFTDYLAFLDLYSRGDPEADLTGDGLVDFSDWLLFFSSFSTGCP